MKLEPDLKIPFTYEVVWKPSEIKFIDRFDKYLDPNFFQHRVSSKCLYFFISSFFKSFRKTCFFHYEDVILFQIHWFSIFNSFMMVIFLVGLVSMILMRTLRKDYARYSKEDDIDDMEKDLGDEYGWKQVNDYLIQSGYCTFAQNMV